LEESLPITDGDDSQEEENGMIDQLEGAAAANHLTFNQIWWKLSLVGICSEVLWLLL